MEPDLILFGKSTKSAAIPASNFAASFPKFFSATMSFFVIVGLRRLRSRTTRSRFSLRPADSIADQLCGNHVYVWLDYVPNWRFL